MPQYTQPPGLTPKISPSPLIVRVPPWWTANKPELNVVDDQVGCPTWTMELANAIVKIIQNKPYGTYHTCGSNSTSWYGFAKEVFKLAGLEVNLKPCTTDKFPRPAKRPAYSIMDNNGICRDWRAALKDYMEIIGRW